jgi:hypothetical protein
VQGVLEDGVLVREQQRVLEREQQHEGQEPELEPEQEQEQEPERRHSLWLRWRGSKRSSSSIRQRSFSKLLRQRCANC